MQDFKIEDFCDSFCASRRTRRMRGNFLEHESGEFSEGRFVVLAECVVNEGGVDVGVRFRF